MDAAAPDLFIAGRIKALSGWATNPLRSISNIPKSLSFAQRIAGKDLSLLGRKVWATLFSWMMVSNIDPGQAILGRPLSAQRRSSRRSKKSEKG
jgi:hypothetical protein